MTRLATLLVMLSLPLLATTARGEGPRSGTVDYLATMRPARDLQAFLDQSVEALVARDSNLRRADVRIVLLDLSGDGPPRLAQHRGELPIYPASVVKFVYLMAAYAWQENGLGHIDGEMDKLLTSMVHDSSNQATRQVFAQLTATEPGPELPPEEYKVFRQRRLAVDRWLATVGITDLHCANPTYDGDGDLYGRDKQFLSDPQIAGGLPAHNGEFANRNTMTAVGTAKLLALLATDRALSPDNSAIVRQRMRRDVVQQPHLAHRLAGSAARLADLEVYSKSGTWGPIYADAGIIHHVSGRQLVLVVFTQAQPPYRGDFIADLAQRVAEHVLSPTSVGR